MIKQVNIYNNIWYRCIYIWCILGVTKNNYWVMTTVSMVNWTLDSIMVDLKDISRIVVWRDIRMIHSSSLQCMLDITVNIYLY